MICIDVDAGDALGRGEAYGRAARDRIRAFLADDLAQINMIRERPLPRDRALEISGRFLAFLDTHLPDLAAEVAGLASGAGILPEEAMLLQVRRELIGWSEDCTSIAFHDHDAGAVIAQTIDLSGVLTRYCHALRYRHATRAGGAILMWTYAGLLGYTGINSHGLAVGINMVRSPGWRIGVPPYLLVRHLLTLSGIDECLQAIGRVPRASSRSLMLAGQGRLVNVEMSVKRHRTIEGRLLTHCNHYLHPDFQAEGQIMPGSSTLVRTRRLAAALAARTEPPDLAWARRLLSDHDGAPQCICAHSDQPRKGKTVSAAVLKPESGEAEFCFGNPCAMPFARFRL